MQTTTKHLGAGLMFTVFALTVFAPHLTRAITVTNLEDDSTWPAEAASADTPLEDRFRQFDRALEFLRDQLVVLQQDIDHGAGANRLVVRRKEPGFRGIYSMKPDGTNVEFMAAAPGMIATGDPQLSHDGRMLACHGMPTFDAANEAKLCVCALDGPFKGRVRDYGYGNTAAWSPDDSQIAYMINDSNPINAKGGAWIMDADGSNRHWITHGWFPRFSPDGKSLLCHGIIDNGGSTLTITDISTKETRQLLKAAGWSLQLYGGNWSPDGKRVVFVGMFDGHDRVATIDASGDDKSIRVLYTNQDQNIQLAGPPAWSPDGKQIVYSAGDRVAVAPRQWWHSYLYSIPADAVDDAKPTLVEGKKVGNINRGMTFSSDGKKLIFSSER